jgi:hypothetical protein
MGDLFRRMRTVFVTISLEIEPALSVAAIERGMARFMPMKTILFSSD